MIPRTTAVSVCLIGLALFTLLYALPAAAQLQGSTVTYNGKLQGTGSCATGRGFYSAAEL
jgi:hypothetical protein